MRWTRSRAAAHVKVCGCDACWSWKRFDVARQLAAAGQLGAGARGAHAHVVAADGTLLEHEAKLAPASAGPLPFNASSNRRAQRVDQHRAHLYAVSNAAATSLPGGQAVMTATSVPA